MVKEALERAIIKNPNSPVAKVVQDSQLASLQAQVTGVVNEIIDESRVERAHRAEDERKVAGRELATILNEVITDKGEELLLEARQQPYSLLGQELRKLENPLTQQEQIFINIGKTARAAYGWNKEIPKLVERNWRGLINQLPECSDKEKAKLMQMLAEGLGISEPETHTFFRNLTLKQRELSGREPERDPAFTIPTQVFVIVVGKMSGLTPKTGTSFLDYLNNKSGLRGSVTIDQIYLPIANWLCEKQPQNPSLDNH